VVLLPNTDRERFDSLTVGCPKVHRYVRDGGDYDFVMWYNGRSKKFNDSQDIVGGSGGLIGRATSKNGVHWERSDGAYEEEEGVVLGLNKDSWWGFDTALAELGCVMLPVSTDAVLTDSGIYMMFYHGAEHGNGEKKGLINSIGVAVSQDGISFGRVEGTHPNNSVLIPEDDEASIESPEVVFSREDNCFRMFYTSVLADGGGRDIRSATSPDGFQWERARGTCIVKGGDKPNVVITRGKSNMWKLYYERGGEIRAVASSDGGKSFGDDELVLAPETNQFRLGSPNVIEKEDGTFLMYYERIDAEGISNICLSESDESGQFGLMDFGIVFN